MEVAAAPEELRSAEALTAAGRVPSQPAGTAQVQEPCAKAGLGFDRGQAEEGPSPARFRDAEAGGPILGIDHALSPSDQTPNLVLAPHSGRAMLWPQACSKNCWACVVQEVTARRSTRRSRDAWVAVPQAEAEASRRHGEVVV